MEAPEYFQNSFCTQFTAENRQFSLDNIIKSNGGGGGSENYMVEVEAYLDIPNDDIGDDGNIFDTLTGISNSTDSSTVTNVIDSSCNSSSFSGSEPYVVASDTGCPNFATVFQDPYVNDGLAGLEFIVEEPRFSSEEIQQMQLISGMKAQSDEAASETRQFQPDTNNNPILNRVVPAKARSKRSRAAPCNWTSRLLLVPPTTPKPEPADVTKTVKAAAPKKKEATPEGTAADGRKCLHCATEKTPQWRTGPMGPKTLCNACGVRYKSGRLVPEYRPAASPTFVLTKHSNSHRKVLELRRQKEMVRAQHHFLHHQPPQHHHHHHHHPNMVFDVTNGGDYLIHQHVGPDFRQLI